MTTLTFVFICGLCFTILITPLIRICAYNLDLVQQPASRDSHSTPKPRLGGIALYLSFILALAASLILQTNVSDLLFDQRYLIILCGATIVFGTGLIDDLYGLKPSTKFISQIVAGIITWYGGVQITVLSISLSSGVDLGWLSLPITLFWIVLVTNAINLIDGLDGLAAGVVLFVSLTMLVLCILNQNYVIAIGFSALAGSTLGFLRYNFNPASIFMGDCGSYFLGYSIAALAIMGSVKGQTTFAMLIPFLALGIPIFDALLAPLRRFAHGKKLFKPDRGHLHHKILKSGEGHRGTVLTLYALTVILSATAFSLVYVKDERAALILLIPTAVLFFLFRKIGYLNYLNIERIYGRLQDITSSLRGNRDNRALYDHQIAIHNARTIDELWLAASHAFAFLELDQAILILSTRLFSGQNHPETYRWNRELKGRVADAGQRFGIEYPLLVHGNQTVFLGRLSVYKYTTAIPISQFTTRRIEQLQRELTRKISELRSQPSLSHDPAHHLSPDPHTLKN